MRGEEEGSGELLAPPGLPRLGLPPPPLPLFTASPLSGGAARPSRSPSPAPLPAQAPPAAGKDPGAAGDSGPASSPLLSPGPGARSPRGDEALPGLSSSGKVTGSVQPGAERLPPAPLLKPPAQPQRPLGAALRPGSLRAAARCRLRLGVPGCPLPFLPSFLPSLPPAPSPLPAFPRPVPGCPLRVSPPTAGSAPVPAEGCSPPPPLCPGLSGSCSDCVSVSCLCMGGRRRGAEAEPAR